MEIIKRKEVTIFKLFIVHLIAFLLAFMIVFIGLFLSAYLLLQKGLLLPANATEQSINHLESRFEGGFDSQLLPANVPYLLLDSQGNTLETNMTQKDLSNTQAYFASGDRPYSTYYKLIELEDGQALVVQYKIMMRFQNPTLARLIPYPEIEGIILLLLVMVLFALLTALRFSRKLKVNLKPIVLATDKIKNQDLDFEIQDTDISEFNQSLKAIDQLKSALRESLEDQWHTRQLQSLQLSALAHDINTPLTVIKGNVELLLEEEADTRAELNAIQSASQSIEKYMHLLMTALNQNIIEADIKLTSLDYFLKDLSDDILPLCQMKSRKFVIINESKIDELRMDPILFKRAIVNLVNNAIAYTLEMTTITLTITENETSIVFEVKDEGKGFSPESLIRATEAFYTEDLSRGNHQGLGLNFVERVCKSHQGGMVIKNRRDTQGAIVRLILPK